LNDEVTKFQPVHVKLNNLENLCTVYNILLEFVFTAKHTQTNKKENRVQYLYNLYAIG